MEQQLDLAISTIIAIATTIATLALISIGLAIIFGIMRVINLAHGEFVMLGSYVVVRLNVEHGISVWLGMLVAPVALALLGALVEVVLMRRLYGRLLDTLLATWGLSLAITQLVVWKYGSFSPGVGTLFGHFTVGKYSIADYNLFLIGMTVAILVALYMILRHTEYGVLARAAAQRPEAAARLGVNVARIRTITFAFGSALAGLTGALLAPSVAVVPTEGQGFVAQAFMTVISGGEAVVTGMLATAGLLGGVQHGVARFATAFFGQAALLLTAIVLLRIFPRGLSGNWARRL